MTKANFLKSPMKTDLYTGEYYDGTTNLYYLRVCVWGENGTETIKTDNVKKYANLKTLNRGVGNPVQIAGKGSTGRTISNLLKEQMAMHQVRLAPLDGATDMSKLKNPVIMTDSRWPASEGWIKMGNNANGVEMYFADSMNFYVSGQIGGSYEDNSLKFMFKADQTLLQGLKRNM